MTNKVIILGAGFAGLELAKNLDSELFDILLIDKVNHHQFQPLFYQVATSQLEPSSISFPIRSIFRGKENIRIRMAEVLYAEPAMKRIYTTVGSFEYDILIIAIGCKTNFFGNEEIKQHAFTLKSTYDAITIRNHILQTFENVLASPESEKEALLNLVIVGAGPTGVELAGAFAEIKKYVLPKDYPRIDFSKFNVYLVEGSNFTLTNMSDKSKEVSEKYLLKMGVNVLKNTFVNHYDGERLQLSNGKTIRSKTVVWTAGVTANTLDGLPLESRAPGNRIRVNRLNQVEGCQAVYAVGDVCFMQTPLYPKGHPQVANVAINQARNLAKNLRAITCGKPTTDYEYKDLGSMATVGKNKAVVEFGKLKMSGLIAWFIWMSLHLMLILGVKNKLIVFINWAWAYFIKDSSLRLILTQQKKDPVDTLYVNTDMPNKWN